MSDEVDRGNEQAEVSLQAHINAVRLRANKILAPIGECYNCGEELADRAFCCPECREDFDKRDLARKRAGA